MRAGSSSWSKISSSSSSHSSPPLSSESDITSIAGNVDSGRHSRTLREGSRRIAGREGENRIRHHYPRSVSKSIVPIHEQYVDGDGGGDDATYGIVHAGVGSTHCANEEFSRLCRSVGWESAAPSNFDMNVALWRKLAANCVVNPLTALHGARNGMLLLDGLEHGGRSVREVSRRLLEEVSMVAMLEVEALDEEDGGADGEGRLESARVQLSVSSLEAFVFGVVADTADNISSMLRRT